MPRRPDRDPGPKTDPPVPSERLGPPGSRTPVKRSSFCIEGPGAGATVRLDRRCRSARIDPPVLRSTCLDQAQLEPSFQVRVFGRATRRHPSPTRPAGSNPRGPPTPTILRRRPIFPRTAGTIHAAGNLRTEDAEKTEPPVPVERRPRADTTPGRQVPTARPGSNTTEPAAGRTPRADRLVLRERQRPADEDPLRRRSRRSVPTTRAGRSESRKAASICRAGRTTLDASQAADAPPAPPAAGRHFCRLLPISLSLRTVPSIRDRPPS